MIFLTPSKFDHLFVWDYQLFSYFKIMLYFFNIVQHQNIVFFDPRRQTSLDFMRMIIYGI